MTEEARACAHPGCRARPLKGEGSCWFHSSAAAERRRAAQAKGGNTRAPKPTTPVAPTPAGPRPPNPWELRTLEDVRRALASTIQLVATGRIDVRKGSALLGGLRELRAALERDDAAGGGLPPGARPLTAEEEAYVAAHDAAPPGVVVGLYGIDHEQPPAAAPPPPAPAEPEPAA